MSYITDLMVQKQDTCPHWNWFDLYGDPSHKAEESKWHRLMFEARLMDEEQVVAARGTFDRPVGETVEERAAATLELMRAGAKLIYKPALIVSDLLGEPDLLERRDEFESALGGWHYVALDVRGGEKVTEAMKNRAVFYGGLLEELQGYRPENGYVITVDGSQFAFPLQEHEFRLNDLLEEIDAIRTTGECPAPHLAAACKQSPWFKECIRLAEATDDLALLYNVKRRDVQRFREAGVTTVAQMAATDLKQFVGTGSSMTTDNLERIRLQAEALIGQTHYHRRPYVLPTAATEVFFDIEADGLRGNFDYLYGFLVRDAAGVRFEKFTAESPAGQEQMWREVLKWFAQLPQDVVIYHYGDHERHSLAVLEARYGGSKTLARLRPQLRDLNEIMKDCLVFPLYFYGLKEIGGYVGYRREAEIAQGAVSVEYYERWLAEQDRALLDAIIHYNREDCEATMALKDWLAGENQKLP
jgi:uncharacterized protein